MRSILAFAFLGTLASAAPALPVRDDSFVFDVLGPCQDRCTAFTQMTNMCRNSSVQTGHSCMSFCARRLEIRDCVQCLESDGTTSVVVDATMGWCPGTTTDIPVLSSTDVVTTTSTSASADASQSSATASPSLTTSSKHDTEVTVTSTTVTSSAGEESTTTPVFTSVTTVIATQPGTGSTVTVTVAASQSIAPVSQAPAISSLHSNSSASSSVSAVSPSKPPQASFTKSAADSGMSIAMGTVFGAVACALLI